MNPSLKFTVVDCAAFKDYSVNFFFLNDEGFRLYKFIFFFLFLSWRFTIFCWRLRLRNWFLLFYNFLRLRMITRPPWRTITWILLNRNNWRLTFSWFNYYFCYKLHLNSFKIYFLFVFLLLLVLNLHSTCFYRLVSLNVNICPIKQKLSAKFNVRFNC